MPRLVSKPLCRDLPRGPAKWPRLPIRTAEGTEDPFPGHCELWLLNPETEKASDLLEWEMEWHTVGVGN